MNLVNLKSDNLSDFSTSVLYLLAAPQTPPPVSDAFLTRKVRVHYERVPVRTVPSAIIEYQKTLRYPPGTLFRRKNHHYTGIS
jgi:hypothetical protein